MRWRAITLALALTTTSTACGPVDALDLAQHSATEPIIGGTRSSATDYPAVGVLLTSGVDAFFGPVATMFCTATLIAPDVVLTAAHCTEVESLVYIGGALDVVNYFSLALDVRSVEQSMTMPEDAIEVVEMIAHPDWDISVLDTFTSGLADLKDIAIAVLASPVSGVEPAMVLENDDQSGVGVGASVEIVGYGQRQVSDSSTTSIKYHATSEIHQVGSSEMQIGSVPSALPQKCHGDSGGPTFLRVADDRWPTLRVIGVTSHAYDDTDCAKGGVDTMVYPYRAWLDQALSAACTSQVRTACADGGGLPLPSDQPPGDAGTPSDAGDTGDASARDASRDSTWPVPRYDAIGDGRVVPQSRDSSDQGCQCRASRQGTRAGWLAGLGALVMLGRRRRAWWRSRRTRPTDLLRR
ncbi:MAG: trypsin-like serine protease [Deltaproteobacteria bacterium]|nr:trypsin-like serine protease [Deltaproteobacteria bacterium]